MSPGGHAGCLHVLPVLSDGPPVSQAGKGRRRLRASIHHSTVLLLHGVAEGMCTGQPFHYGNKLARKITEDTVTDYLSG